MVSTDVRRQPNPLEQAASAAPARLASVARMAATLAGIAAALFIAVDEAYDETQVFAACVAAVALLTMAPVGGRFGGAWTVSGGALLFYAGALLFSVSIGPAMLVLGAVATLSALVTNHHRHGSAGLAVAALFAPMAVVVALVLAIVFAVGG